MLRYIYGDELHQFPKLRDTMFRDRADQFKERLNWDVSVDNQGEEHDEYDDLNPLYAIWQKSDGTHGGSMRFLPTVGQTMVNDHFSHLTDGVRIQSPLIWECTRFCLARDSEANVAAAMMLAGGEILDNFALEHLLGVFDARMVRIYRMIGASPTVLGTSGEGRDAISVGLWEFTAEGKVQVAKKAGLTPEISAHWFEQAFGSDQLIAMTA